ncbi:MAG TPA: FAD-dependent oxidoreductase, partial [Dehalococcoidia bacterium]|nr:FAD-dependent oxidoreductase [Dehalococcoidia bacterium]
MAEIDVAVIGGGAVGLAIAAEIAGRGRSVCVLERHPRPGMETSTHNSGVVHAGLYHPTNSLKT